MINTDLTPRTLIGEIRGAGWTWQTAGAVFGLFFGIISPLIGSALTAIAWLKGSGWHGLPLQRTGTVLLFLTIPLLVFGAHCLDLIDKQNKRAT